MNIFAALLHLALLTSDKYTEKPDDTLLIKAFYDHEVKAEHVDWNAPVEVFEDYDAVLVYSCWDYYEDPTKFLNLLSQIEKRGIQVYNSPTDIAWNARKTYLRDLNKLGLKTIDTIFLSPDELENLPSLMKEKNWDECVIKPQISASGHNTYRFNLSTVEKMQTRFLNSNEQLMVQPFAKEVIQEGEWSFVFVNNEYMHCLLKKPKEGNFLVQGGEKIVVQPPEWMLRDVQKIVDTINLPVFQMRVDVIRRDDELRIMEVEIIEPALYLRLFPGSENVVAKKMKERLMCIKS